MKNQLLVALIVVGFLVISCGPPAPEKHAKGGGRGNTPTVSEEDTARALQTSLLFDQMASTKQLLEITKTDKAVAGGCKTITPMPGENPFMRIQYMGCQTKIFGNKTGTFLGIEEFSVVNNKIVAEADLQLSLDGKFYDWTRTLSITAKLEDLLSQKGFSFRLKSDVVPRQDGTMKSWSIDIFGRAKLSNAGKLENFAANLNSTVAYTRPKYIPAKKQNEAIQAHVQLIALQDVAFQDNCRLVGRFKFNASEGTKTNGVLQSDGSHMSDPDRNDPVFNKPAPLPKCE